MRARNGFVLLTVVWFLAGSVALATAAMLVAREHQSTTANRAALIRAEWRAEDCIARARAAMSETLRRPERAGEPSGGELSAIAFREAVLGSRIVQACPGDVDLEPFGMRTDVNTAPAAQIKRSLLAYGIPAALVDSMTDAALDWRDADDVPLPLGAERGWYETMGLRPPRNAPLADATELRFVRGFAEWMQSQDGMGVDALFGVDNVLVHLDAARPEVLRGLPGIGEATVDAIVNDRAHRSRRLRELLTIVGVAPQDARPEIERAFVELSGASTVSTAGWVLRARSSGVTGDPRAPKLVSEMEIRLVPDGTRFAVTRRRIAP